jgi:hypothetical protein
MRATVALLLACLPAVAGAQTTYKCLDAQKRVTYSNIACDKQGLSDAGTVAERVTSMPFTAPPKPAEAPAVPPKPAAAGGAEVPGPAVQIKPLVPLIEKLAK